MCSNFWNWFSIERDRFSCQPWNIYHVHLWGRWHSACFLPLTGVHCYSKCLTTLSKRIPAEKSLDPFCFVIVSNKDSLVEKSHTEISPWVLSCSRKGTVEMWARVPERSVCQSLLRWTTESVAYAAFHLPRKTEVGAGNNVGKPRQMPPGKL